MRTINEHCVVFIAIYTSERISPLVSCGECTTDQKPFLYPQSRDGFAVFDWETAPPDRLAEVRMRCVIP